MNSCGPPYYIAQSIPIDMKRNTKFQVRTLILKRLHGLSFMAGLGHGLRLLVALALTVASAAPDQATAQPRGRELLNSERIEQAFGSYGVEVLASDGRTRITNLYSSDGGMMTCRTFAVVRLPAAIDAALAAEHAAITAGGSIGAVFAANGWRVVKTHLAFRDVAATPRLASLMRVPAGTRLAADAYVLDVEKQGRTLPYAALLEIHHPGYLTVADLARIYGTPDVGGRGVVLDDLLAAAAKAAE
jgi:hypothetical protein